jgi:thymidylate synthase (FAD)
MSARPINPGAEMHLGVRHAVPFIGAITLRDYCGTDASISRAARVSYGREDAARGSDADARLIGYLVRHRHTSPLEMAELVFEVSAPIFVARQWLRHRTASVNERSLRYTEPMSEAEIMPAEGLGDLCADPEPGASKQGRGAPVQAMSFARVIVRDALMTSLGYHQQLRRGGVSREQARSVLPLATMTSFVWKVDLHNLLHFLALRTAPDAQRETRLLAEQVAAVVADAFPLTWAAWVEHVRDAPRLSASAWRALAALLNPDDLPGALAGLPERERRETMAAITAAWASRSGGAQ